VIREGGLWPQAARFHVFARNQRRRGTAPVMLFRLGARPAGCSRCTVAACRQGNRGGKTRFAGNIQLNSGTDVHNERNPARAVRSEHDSRVRHDFSVRNEQGTPFMGVGLENPCDERAQRADACSGRASRAGILQLPCKMSRGLQSPCQTSAIVQRLCGMSRNCATAAPQTHFDGYCAPKDRGSAHAEVALLGRILGRIGRRRRDFGDGRLDLRSNRSFSLSSQTNATKEAYRRTIVAQLRRKKAASPRARSAACASRGVGRP
jgi:hypothetical protein